MMYLRRAKLRILLVIINTEKIEVEILSTAGGEKVENGVTNLYINIDVFAKNGKVNVTLNANGGVINSGNVTEYEEDISIILPTNVTRVGYKFLGWYEDPDFLYEFTSGTSITSFSRIIFL